SADRVIAKLVEELQQYEQKYGMRSEIFYALIVGTPAEDHPDFLQWAICYRSYFRTVRAKFPMKELAAYAVSEPSPGSAPRSLLVCLLLAHRRFYPSADLSHRVSGCCRGYSPDTRASRRCLVDQSAHSPPTRRVHIRGTGLGDPPL